jgi:penicillin amidase
MAGSAAAIVRSLLLGEENPEDYGLDLEGILRSAASDALNYLRQALGPNVSDWAWNEAHHVHLSHPAASTGAMKELMNLGPFSCPGGGGVVNNRRPVETPQGFVNASGVSYRLFVDMSDPGKAWAASLAGQSGQPGSDHYADRVQETLSNEYHPLLMDRPEIEREAVHEFTAPSDDQQHGD